MSEILIYQMPSFKKAYKKLVKQEKTEVNKAIQAIIKDPTLGQEKKGDLAKIFVYKFKIKTKQLLLAYEWCAKSRTLIALGVHEHFYRNLKH